MIARVAGDEIVEADHLVAFGDQPVAQMGADETGGAGHYESQPMLPIYLS